MSTPGWRDYISKKDMTAEVRAAVEETADYIGDCLKNSNGADTAVIQQKLEGLFREHTLDEYVTGTALYNTKNTEANAIVKALQSKLKSVYNRELKRIMRYREKEEPTISQRVVQKKKPEKREKIERTCVTTFHPDLNNEWTQGITKICLDFCRVGLANFSTFAAFFYYFLSGDPYKNTPMVAKLKAREDGSGKDVVFVTI